MFRLITFSLLVATAPFGPFVYQLSAQETSEPQTEETDSAEPPAPVELRGVMVMRISERYLESLFSKDIDKTTPVSRQVLGTRARGTAHTTGTTDIETKPDSDDAAFSLRVIGTSRSRTVGRNGPAIIHSRSITTWQCNKVVRFDGMRFHTSPGTIESTTRIIPQGVSATVPGLRGRLVERIANKRVCESLPQAEQITGRKTEQRVLADVNSIVDGKIERLNERISTRPIASALLPMMQTVGVQFSTNEKCININFLGDDSWPVAKVVPVGDDEPSDTELWLQLALLSSPPNDIAETIDNAGSWLAKYLPDVEIPGIDLVSDQPGSVLPFDVQIVKGWVVFRSKKLPSPLADDKPDPAVLIR